jgi:GT2 family glycosyltransferase
MRLFPAVPTRLFAAAAVSVSTTTAPSPDVSSRSLRRRVHSTSRAEGHPDAQFRQYRATDQIQLLLRLAAMTQGSNRSPTLSVIVPTRNRPESVRRTVAHLRDQDLSPSHYEVIVVDDGSKPPVEREGLEGPLVRLLRRAGGERSAARNSGAGIARGELLLFIDDDITAERGFLTAHLAGHRDWPGALAVGAVHLPPGIAGTPFGRFRVHLETAGTPTISGPVESPTFCTAANMSIARARFRQLGGFDPEIISAEDQDLALRHVGSGGRIVFLADARVIHEDSAVDVRAYCRRHEWGAEQMVPFVLRHPERRENLQRIRVNGPVRWRSDPPLRIVMKLSKTLLSSRAGNAVLFAVTAFFEARRPASRTLEALYRLALGVHLQRGFQRGWVRQARLDEEAARAR